MNFPLTTVARAAAQVKRRERQLLQARKELVAAIGAAHDAGEATAAIAEVAGLSRQRISRLLRERRAKKERSPARKCGNRLTRLEGVGRPEEPVEMASLDVPDIDGNEAPVRAKRRQSPLAAGASAQKMLGPGNFVRLAPNALPPPNASGSACQVGVRDSSATVAIAQERFPAVPSG